MSIINQDRLKIKALDYNIDLSNEMLDQLDLYSSLLVEWNQKFNLTNIIEAEEIENKHFIDSLLFAMQPEVRGKIADVGTGAGFPGIVAKILKQKQIQLTLIEPTGKRILFLNEVCSRLNLEIEILKERGEEAARKKWRESFDIVTARAVAPLSVLTEYCLPLVKLDGFFIPLKTESELVEENSSANVKLGGKYTKSLNYNLPDGSNRQIIFIKKVESTPSVYPRNGGTIKKRPL